jgi:cell fate (sporulation/competence/biofilm development) regulator YlbF (YheA/YmcA/DUF963 family)
MPRRESDRLSDFILSRDICDFYLTMFVLGELDGCVFCQHPLFCTRVFVQNGLQKIRKREMRCCMNRDITMGMENLIAMIHSSQEYNQYQNLLDTIKSQPEIYQRIAQFRRRSVLIQTQENVDMISENNTLQNEFFDLQQNGLASEFMAAEHQYVQMLREIQTKFLNNLDLEINFLDE